MTAPGEVAGWGLFLRVLIAQAGPVAGRLRVRDLDDDEGRRLLRIRPPGQRVGGDLAAGADGAAVGSRHGRGRDREGVVHRRGRVRDVIHNFDAAGFSSLYPRYKGGRPPKFTLTQRREVKKIAKSRPPDHDLPFSTWSLPKLADFLVEPESP
jgi:hypothetical protein